MTIESEAKTILIIEDEPNIIKFTSRVLELEGFRIQKAGNGSEGLKIIKESRVDLILLDLMLPGTDGWAILDEVKNDSKLAAIPVIVFTASVEHQNQQRAFSMGAVDFLMKPFTAASLKEMVHGILYKGEA